MQPQPTVRALLLDLLMATMDSPRVWAAAAGSPELGMAWRDAVTARMIQAGRYRPYEKLVADAVTELGLAADAGALLRAAWRQMEPWPDAAALGQLSVPIAFVTNCSRKLAAEAVDRSGLDPVLTLSAEEAGWFKPRPEIYRQACERLGAPPSEIAFVAGAAYDAIGAAGAGLRSTLVARRPLAHQVPAEIAVVRRIDQALAVVAGCPPGKEG